MNDNLLEVEDLKKYFKVKGRTVKKSHSLVRAVDGVSFQVRKGEVLGVVGESGSGKTTLARTVLRLYDHTAGRVLFEGKDVFSLQKKELRELRQHMQIVFQDPYSSLNPRMTIAGVLRQILNTYKFPKSEIEGRIHETVKMAGLSPDQLRRFPHEFSGGQRQRVAIARALVLGPKFLVADEPTSALDMSVQSQILNLMKELQERLHLTYLFITHDLSVIRFITDRVAVMYVGKIVELASRQEIFASPQHPYTEALFSSCPVPDPEVKLEPILLEGDIPSPVEPPPGCRFHPRCPVAIDICPEVEPQLKEVTPGHYVACHLRG